VSDIDMYMKEQRGQERAAPRKKQDRFEIRVLGQTLRALEPQPGWAKKLMYEVGDDLGFKWFNDRYEQCPLKLGTYKLKDTVGILAIMKRYNKTALCSEFEEMRSNYPDSNIGLVFDSVGNGLSELVIHNWRTEGLLTLLGWRLQIKDETGGWLEVVPLKGFLKLLSYNFELEDV